MCILSLWLESPFSAIHQFLLFIFLIVIPGLLVVLSLRPVDTPGWKLIPLVPGFSIAILMMGGYLINETLPLLGVKEPLSIEVLRIALALLLLPLFALSYFRSRRMLLKIGFSVESLIRLTKYIPLALFPIVAALGAFLQNDGGSNALTMILLGSVTIFSFYVLFKRNHSDLFIVTSIFSISLATLLMLSLRSWHISGSDIHDEYKVFQVTQFFNHWSMENFKHAYNACLSITILPTIISNITQSPGEFIYKFYYQIFFALVPASMYILFRKYASQKIAYFSVLYLVSQPFFIQPMTSLLRQEVAFLFFSLLLLCSFNDFFGKWKNFGVLVALSLSIVVSHYSTTYVSILFIASTIMIRTLYELISRFQVLRKTLKLVKLYSPPQKNNFQFGVLIVMLLFTYLWYSQLTKSADNLVDSVNKTFSNMKGVMNLEVNNQETSQALSIFKSDSINSNVLEEYNEAALNDFKDSKDPRYTLNESANLRLYFNSPTPGIIETPQRGQIHSFFQLHKNFTKLFVLVGTLYLVVVLYRKNKLDKEFIILCGVGSSVIFLMLFHPTLSGMYNLSRIYLQTLIFLSLPAYFGGMAMLFFIPKAVRSHLVSISIILIYLYSHGFISQIIGGGVPYMQLNNFGEDYDKFYTHSSEILSARWLNIHKEPKVPLFADKLSYTRLKSFGNPENIVTSISPSIIYRNSYVYARYLNFAKGQTQDNYRSQSLLFEFPNDFLSENKSLIYSNGESAVYR